MSNTVMFTVAASHAHRPVAGWTGPLAPSVRPRRTAPLARSLKGTGVPTGYPTTTVIDQTLLAVASDGPLGARPWRRPPVTHH